MSSTRSIIQNRYQLLSIIGQGGMGTVYKAYDRLEKQYVALKQVLVTPNELDFASKPTTRNTSKLRLGLAKEFSILASLRHPHILSVLDYGFDEAGHPFYTMTLLDDAVDVKTYAQQQPDDGKFALLTQILQALHYLHRRSILHRDLKPDNVFVTRDGNVQVMDFGLAIVDANTAKSAQDEKNSGTLMYMAPELFQGTGASRVSDLWSFGVVAYEVLLGQHPFRDYSLAMLVGMVSATIDMSGLSPALKTWLDHLLQTNPAARQGSAYDALTDLYATQQRAVPQQAQAIRESFLQASTFLGRQVELEQLTAALDAVNTENAFFLIGGESGVGKSRLIDELRIRALVRDVFVMRGQGVEGGGLPFQLWRQIVRRLMLLVDPTDFQAGVLKALVPDMNELLEREIPNAPELTGRAFQERIVLTIVDLLRGVPRPILLLLEDLQWAAQSLAPLQQILLVQQQLPSLMIVASYRDEESPTLVDTLKGMSHLKLERLDGSAVAALSKAMLGEAGANAAVVELLRTQSEGNTFFMIETVRALAEESGQLEQIGTAALPPSVLTGGMQALMRRRLNRVNAEYTELQTLAAVIGREVDMSLLEHVHGQTNVQRWLNNAGDVGVLQVYGNVWRFAHDKLRETIVSSISDSTRRTLHRTAAEAIEAVYAEDDSYNETLMLHWREAGDFDKELTYLDTVAEHMLEIQGAYDAARRLLEDALNRLPADDPRRVAVLNWLSWAHETLGDYDAATTYAQQARQLAEHNGDRHGLADSLQFLGLIAYDQGDYDRATTFFHQSLDISQQLGARRVTAISMLILGVIAYGQGDYERAAKHFQHSLEISQQLGDQHGIAGGLNNLGIVAYSQADYDRAAELYQQSLAIRRQQGNERGIAGSLNNLGMIAQHQGNLGRARELFQQSLAIWQQLGDQRGVANNLDNLGQIARQQEDYKRAGELFQQGLAIRQQLGNRANESESLFFVGWIALQDSTVSALAYFTEGLALAQRVGSLSVQLLHLIGFAAVSRQNGKLLRAAELLALVQDHSAANSEVKQLVGEVMVQLEATLSAEDLQAALDRGNKRELEVLVNTLLVELETHRDDKGQRFDINDSQFDAAIVNAMGQHHDNGASA